MDGEGALVEVNVEQAIYWRQIYRDLLKIERASLLTSASSCPGSRPRRAGTSS
jgi:hypothetical protein